MEQTTEHTTTAHRRDDTAPELREPLDPGRLEGLEPLHRIAGRNATKADVVVYRLDGRRIAVKTYAPRPWWVRWTVGRFLVRREAAAYRAAAGAPGLPVCYGRVGPYAVATEWVDGQSLAQLRGRPVDPAVFDRIDAVLDHLHDRGVALADLHHRDVLVGDDGSVHLVDLATAFRLGERPGRLRRRFFVRMREQDRVAAARLRARWTGIDEREAIAAVSPEAAEWYRKARRLKAFWDRLRGKRRG